MIGNRRRIYQIVLSSTWILAAAFAQKGKHPAEHHPFVRVSDRNPRYFELTSGDPFVPIGLNLIHPTRDYRKFGPKPQAANTGEENREEAAGLSEMEHWMDRLSHNSGNFVRVCLVGNSGTKSTQWLGAGIWIYLLFHDHW